MDKVNNTDINYIYKIMNKYNREYKILDEEAIKEIIDIVVETLDIKDYFKGYFIKSELEKRNYGTYNVYTNEISINTNLKLNKKMYDETSSLFIINYSIVFTIFHELRHCYQCKQVEQSDSYIDKEIYKTGICFLTQKYDENKDKLKNKIYNNISFILLGYRYLHKYITYAPIERDANYFSFNNLKDIYPYPEEFYYLFFTYDEKYLSPIFKYLSFIDSFKILKSNYDGYLDLSCLNIDINNISNYTKEELLDIKNDIINNNSFELRYRFGLPITKEERLLILRDYDKVLKRTKKGNNNA